MPPFLPDKRNHQIAETMKYRDGKNIKTQIGIVAGSIGRKDNLMYCPDCVNEDIKKHREAYFHRIHQLEGVLVCPEHECFLKEYPVGRNRVSRLEFIKFDDKVIDLGKTYIDDNKIFKIVDIARGAKFLLENSLVNYNKDIVHDKYMELLNKKGLLTPQGHIRQRDVYQEFKTFYNNKVLNMLGSNIEVDSEYNWLKIALRNEDRVIHPIRNILIILFLSNSMENFFLSCSSTPKKVQYYPCLNPACKNYRKLVITKYEISYDSKAKLNIGTYYCSCGFVYSRKITDDVYKVGRIKEFGPVWEDKLKELIVQGSSSIRQISLRLGCDPKTVVKYADKLGIKHLLITTMKASYDRSEKRKNAIDSNMYKSQVLETIRENPGITRNKIRKRMGKQYMWLYKNDRQWFEENMPTKVGTTGNNNNHNVSWAERDDKMLELIKNEYNMLIQLNENVRITKSLLGRRINMLALLEKKLDKLPKTKKYLDEIMETVEDFQIRRVYRVCSKMKEDEQDLQRWKIIKKAGLKGVCAERVEKQIQIYLSKNSDDI